MPRKHTMTVEVSFPNTGVPVREMLAALAAYLHEDAARYKKEYKTTDADPAVQDKTDTAESLEKLVDELHTRSKARWAAHNRKAAT